MGHEGLPSVNGSMTPTGAAALVPERSGKGHQHGCWVAQFTFWAPVGGTIGVRADVPMIADPLCALFIRSLRRSNPQH